MAENKLSIDFTPLLLFRGRKYLTQPSEQKQPITYKGENYPVEPSTKDDEAGSSLQLELEAGRHFVGLQLGYTKAQYKDEYVVGGAPPVDPVKVATREPRNAGLNFLYGYNVLQARDDKDRLEMSLSFYGGVGANLYVDQARVTTGDVLVGGSYGVISSYMVTKPVGKPLVRVAGQVLAGIDLSVYAPITKGSTIRLGLSAEAGATTNFKDLSSVWANPPVIHLGYQVDF